MFKNKNKKYKQGIYKPKNLKKYKGKNHPRYLSSWELKFFRWCDESIHIIEWSSESVHIPYINPLTGRVHKYMVDNHIVIERNGVKTKYLVEIKPYKQTLKPTKHGNKKKSTLLYESVEYVRNQAKWSAARKWCEKKDFTFKIITEKDLFTNR